MNVIDLQKIREQRGAEYQEVPGIGLGIWIGLGFALIPSLALWWLFFWAVGIL